MRAKLKVRPAEGEAYEVEVGNTATIGRSRDNTVSLHTNPHVSRQHAVIRCHNAYQFQIMDLGSRNGTLSTAAGSSRPLFSPMALSSASPITNSSSNNLTTSQDATYDITIATGTDAAHDQNAVVAVMVCDIRGFSTMSEILAEDELARKLGQWFRDAGNIVHETGGTIDKFIGDAVLAYWTRETQDGRESRCALDSALKLLKTAAGRSWSAAETRKFEIAVALHHGVVTCGNMGVVAQRDATIIGDTVNTVFRIESVMKQLNQKLTASQDFLSTLSDPKITLADLGEHRLKGKYQPVRLFGMA